MMKASKLGHNGIGWPATSDLRIAEIRVREARALRNVVSAGF